MLENQFFPTHLSIAKLMIQPFLKQTDPEILAMLGRNRGAYLKSQFLEQGVIDPQAGNGALLKHLRELCEFQFGDKSQIELCAVEIDRQLRVILDAEGFAVIGTNWLEYSEPRKFSLILSNPPFAEGVEHCLKSIEHLAPKGGLACLLNAESLRNPYTKERRRLLMQLALSWGIDAEEYGISINTRYAGEDGEEAIKGLLAEIEAAGGLKWLGSCFASVEAERRTDVEVVCVWIIAPDRPNAGINWADGDFEPASEPESPEFQSNPLAHRSVIKRLAAQYRAARDLIVERAELESKLAYFLIEAQDCYAANNEGSRVNLLSKLEYNEQLELLRGLFWSIIFKKIDLGKRIGSSEEKRFTQFAKTQSRMEFNEANIVEMIEIIIGDMGGIMSRLVVEVFDKMIGYHADNRVHSEGWKTNAPGKIKNNKLIFPHGVVFNQYFNSFSVYQENFWDDLDKALCWVSGMDYEHLQQRQHTTGLILKAQCDLCSGNRSAKHDEKLFSHFFVVRMHKKGTVHLWFRDAQVAKDFAIKAAEGRAWIAEQDAS
jgi:hypothetical protein